MKWAHIKYRSIRLDVRWFDVAADAQGGGIAEPGYGFGV